MKENTEGEEERELNGISSVLQMRFSCIHGKYDSQCCAIFGNHKIYSEGGIRKSIPDAPEIS